MKQPERYEQQTAQDEVRRPFSTAGECHKGRNEHDRNDPALDGQLQSRLLGGVEHPVGFRLFGVAGHGTEHDRHKPNFKSQSD
ncbi:MAG: hypothetical protein AAFY24_20470 [Pseudomonadota bacterium]